MTTVSAADQWFDESAEALIGLPIAVAVLDVMRAGLAVEISRPETHRVRDSSWTGVSLVANPQGVVVHVLRSGHDAWEAESQLAARRTSS